MPQYTPQQLEERLQKLPQVLQEAMFSPDIATKMFALGKKQGLTIDKIGFMAEETGYVILGLTKPQEFAGVLQKRLETDAEKARTIASEINREVFYPLREALKQTHNIDLEAGSPAPSRQVGRYGAGTQQEAGEMAAVPPKTTEPPSVPQPPKPKETPAPVPPPPPKPPSPPLLPRPAPIDLRPQPAMKSQPQKPPLSELLPKVPVPVPIPSTPLPPSPNPTPTQEARIKKQELKGTEQPTPKPPEPSKSPASQPRPEVMPGGGIFAAPMESREKNQELREEKTKVTDSVTLKSKQQIQQTDKFDPYRESLE